MWARQVRNSIEHSEKHVAKVPATDGPVIRTHPSGAHEYVLNPLRATRLSTILEYDTSSQPQRDWVRVRVRTEYVLKYVRGESAGCSRKKNLVFLQKCAQARALWCRRKHSRNRLAQIEKLAKLWAKTNIFFLEISQISKIGSNRCMVSLIFVVEFVIRYQNNWTSDE